MGFRVDDETATEAVPEGVPPQAIERLKRERETARAEAEQAKADVATATEALAKVALVDSIHDYLDGLEGPNVPSDPRKAAKFLARQMPVDTEDVPAAVESLRAEISALQPQNDIPPPPLMAGGPQPGATGADLESGPYRIGSEEFVKFISEHGRQATNQAIAEGMFFDSDENRAAQETAGLV